MNLPQTPLEWARLENEPPGLARRTVEALEGACPPDQVHIACWNKAEADEVLALIPERHRARVWLSWYTFGQ